MHFDDAYREKVRLPGGLTVTLRLVSPGDKELIQRGLALLSPESRYFRFMALRGSLSAGELRYLTELDGVSHFAMGAVQERDDGSEEGLAIARFVRLPDEPEVAEPAITVLDSHQGQGLGRLLLERLISAAHERGVRTFCCEFLTDNLRVRALLAAYDQDSTIHEDPATGTVVMRFPLPEPSLGERFLAALRASAMYGAFVDVARGVLALRWGRTLDAQTPPPRTDEPGPKR